MTLKELKMKVLALIEELNANSTLLTDDPDIALKINDVTNQILFELARIKKIPKYFEMEVHKGDLLDFSALEKKCGYEIYQIGNVGGIKYATKADGTVIKVLQGGVAEVDVFVYPERIASTTKDSYEFELSADALEVAPYGIAADILKADVSTEYGNIYAIRYENMKQMLDPRYQAANIYFEGGVKI